jgi:hypothetical protein
MKKKRLLSNIFIVFLIIITWISKGLPFSKAMHEAINGSIAQRTINGFSLDYYLINQLGLKDGVSELKKQDGDAHKDIN